MLKTVSAADPINKNPEQGGQGVQWRIEMKKSKHKKVVKAKKWLNLKSRSKPKKQRPLELKTLVNQVCSLLPTLGEPLLN